MTLDVAAIRKDFPILSRTVHGKPLVFLDSAASAQKPRAVIEAMVDLYSAHYANVHRGVYQLSIEATDMLEAVRDKFGFGFHLLHDVHHRLTPIEAARLGKAVEHLRLFWMEDSQLRLWVLNGGMWEIDPDTGESVEVPRKPPVLWSPDGRYRIVVTEDGTTSTLSRIDW